MLEKVQVVWKQGPTGPLAGYNGRWMVPSGVGVCAPAGCDTRVAPPEVGMCEWVIPDLAFADDDYAGFPISGAPTFLMSGTKAPYKLRFVADTERGRGVMAPVTVVTPEGRTLNFIVRPGEDFQLEGSYCPKWATIWGPGWEMLGPGDEVDCWIDWYQGRDGRLTGLAFPAFSSQKIVPITMGPVYKIDDHTLVLGREATVQAEWNGGELVIRIR